jgi:hypothetical protein
MTMYQHKADMNLFMKNELKIPPPRPPWMSQAFSSNSGRRAGRGDFYDAYEGEIVISESESLGSFSKDMGPPPSVPSWTRSTRSGRASSRTPSGKPPSLNPGSVRSRSFGGV